MVAWPGSSSPKRSPKVGSTACGWPATPSIRARHDPADDLLDPITVGVCRAVSSVRRRGSPTRSRRRGRADGDWPGGDRISQHRDVTTTGPARYDGGRTPAQNTLACRLPSTPWRCCFPPRRATSPAGPRRARRRSMGTKPLGRCRTRRQDPRHRWSGPDRQARRRLGERVLDATRRLRPVRFRPTVARQMGVELLPARPGRRRIRFPHDPPAAVTKNRPGSSHDLLVKAKPTLPVRHQPSQRGGHSWSTPSDPRRLDIPRRRNRRCRRSTCSRSSRPPPPRRCSSSTEWWRRPSGGDTREVTGQGRRHDRPWSQLALAGEFVASLACQRERRRGERDDVSVLPLAERLGRLFGSARRPRSRARSSAASKVTYGGYDTAHLGLAVSKGFFGGISDEPVTFVNASQPRRTTGSRFRDVN